jgi:hypothetical protein
MENVAPLMWDGAEFQSLGTTHLTCCTTLADSALDKRTPARLITQWKRNQPTPQNLTRMRLPSASQLLASALDVRGPMAPLCGGSNLVRLAAAIA